MNITHFIDSQTQGGAEVMALELAEHQQQIHNISIICFQNEFIQNRCRKLNIPVIPIPAHTLYKSTATLPLYSLFLAYHLISNRVDVLHSHLFGSVTGNALACMLSGVRHIGTLHDTYMVEEKLARKHLLSMSLAFGTHIVCVSKSMEAFYRNMLPFYFSRLQTIYNGIASPVALSNKDRCVARRKLGFTDHSVVFLVVGRLVGLKRVNSIIRAFASVQHNIDCSLVIVGNGPEEVALKQLSGELGLKQNINFPGQVENVLSYFQIADVFVQFSETEGLSKSILEAMAAELPCIVSDVGGNSELVDNNKNGFICHKDDFTDIARRMLELGQDENLRNKMGKEARNKTESLFDLNTFQNSYLKLYTD